MHTHTNTRYTLSQVIECGYCTVLYVSNDDKQEYPSRSKIKSRIVETALCAVQDAEVNFVHSYIHVAL